MMRLATQFAGSHVSTDTVNLMIALEQLDEILMTHVFRFTNERDLQDGIALALTAASIPFTREHRLGATDRVDFLIAPGIAVEIKVDGSLMALLRQVQRYASHVAVQSIVVIGTPAWLTKMPVEISGKPLHGHRLMASMF